MQCVLILVVYFKYDKKAVLAPFVLGVLIWVAFYLVPMKFLLGKCFPNLMARRKRSQARPTCVLSSLLLPNQRQLIDRCHDCECNCLGASAACMHRAV